MSIREMLEKIDGVIYALPDGGDSTVLVHLKKAESLKEDAVKKQIEKSGKFKLKSFSSKSLVKSKS